MNEGNKPKDGEQPDDGQTILNISIKPDLDVMNNSNRNEKQMEFSCCWTWLSVFAAVIVLFLVISIGGVCRFHPVDSVSWPYVAMIAVFLSAIVSLCWIGCRHAARMEKMESEERKQKVDVRRFLFEKSIELAQAMSKGGGESSKKVHSVSILLHRPCDGGNTKPAGTDNGNGGAPTTPPTQPCHPQPGGCPASTERNDATSFYRDCQNASQQSTCDCSQTTAQTVTSAGMHNDQ